MTVKQWGNFMTIQQAKNLLDTLKRMQEVKNQELKLIGEMINAVSKRIETEKAGG